MTIPYPTGWFEKSGIVHYIGSHYESVGGGYIGASLCGRMKGLIRDYDWGRREVRCKACLDKMGEEVRKIEGMGK